MTDRGFSLMEVLVALSVFSIAAISLVHLVSGLSTGAQQLNVKTLASIEADTRLALLVSEPDAPVILSRSGNSEQLGRELSWTESVSTTTMEGVFLAEVRVLSEDGKVLLADRQQLIGAAP
ncbi:MAG: type II secretion system minor pseudopilin GspI [Hyphomonas sp.]|nr:type II secretion system minor pseudopilin GspI [Hyphomonas sp.]